MEPNSASQLITIAELIHIVEYQKTTSLEGYNHEV